jgi:putative transposase
MPNHVHLLITVDINMTIEKAVQLIKGGFSFQARKLLGSKAPFWQRGFSEIRVLDSDSFENHRRHIHNNPVKAHLVGKAEEYPYSSASQTSGLDPMPERLRPAFSAQLYDHLGV